MSYRTMLAAAVVAATLVTAAVAADVKVTASRDISNREFRWAGEREATIAELRRHLQMLGGRYLKPGQSLSVELLDIDLAGDIKPLRRDLSDVRVMTNATPPRITLRYTLRQGGRVLRQATETLSDSSYLTGSATRSHDRLVYEKQMLGEWFERRFGRSRS